MLRNLRDRDTLSNRIISWKKILDRSFTFVLYSKSFKLNTVFYKKCALVGSCFGEKFAEVRIDSKLKNLRGYFNESLGFAYSQETCKCACCGFLLCSAAYLFYQTYAKPLSEKVYEFFLYPILMPSNTLSIQLNKSQKLAEEKRILRGFEMFKLGTVRLGLVNAHIPPLPNGEQTFFIRC